LCGGFSSPYEERFHQAAKFVNGLVDRSGVKTLPQKLAGATAVGIAAVGGVVAYEVYPALMVAAGTPRGQSIISNFVDFSFSAVPSTSPTPNVSGAAGVIVDETVKYFSGPGEYNIMYP